ncbi:MAG TPA: hypothetical protein VGY31_03385 [Terriglobia bacterium]|nr:hypothetical protein [Terriglobia bacterium]
MKSIKTEVMEKIKKSWLEIDCLSSDLIFVHENILEKDCHPKRQDCSCDCATAIKDIEKCAEKMQSLILMWEFKNG